MGFIRVFFIGTAAAIAAISLGLIPGMLPPPAEKHIVQPIPFLHRPGELKGDFAPNDHLLKATRLFEGKINGSESLAISPSGKRLFLADKFGWIYAADIIENDNRISVRLDPASPFVQVKGRPLGIHAVDEKTLMVCDSLEGLVYVDLAAKRVVTLANKTTKRRRGTRRSSQIVYANDLDVSRSKTVYFTDSTDIPTAKTKEGYYSTLRSFVLNILEGRSSGRLLSYNPVTNSTLEVLGQLWYANGVAIAANEAFVAVVETNRFRVHRYWLKGRRAKESDLLVSNLPGYPDGISTSPDGNFWIAVLAPVPPIWSLAQARIVRLAYAWLTEYVPLPFRTWGYIVKVSPDGDILRVLTDIHGKRIRGVSSVVERDGRLFMGNLVGNYISLLNLKDLEPTVPNQTISNTAAKKEEL